MDELKQETQVFESHLPEWRTSHLGDFVLIKGKDVLGFFNSLEAAFSEGTRRFGLDPFLVKQIMPEEVVNVSFFGKQLDAA